MGNRGSLGSSTNSPVIDDGTMCLQASPVPGPMGLQDTSLAILTPAAFLAPATTGVAGAASSSPAAPMPTAFHPGVSHGHSPCGRWAEVQKNPNSSNLRVNAACRVMSPSQLVDTAKFFEFKGKPIALIHLNYYLAGSGADFKEDANIDLWLRRDQGIQAAIASRLPKGRTSGVFSSSFKFEQDEFKDEDFHFAFGAIDIVDFEADFSAGTVHVWFQDFYEWHPFYPGLYSVLPGDGARETNAVHAALVELKSSGAKDYWMKGEATVPLSVIVPGPGSSSGGKGDL